MARPLRIEYPGAFYHITSKGNESAVSQASHRFKMALDNDRKLRKKINHIRRRLNL